MSITNGMPLINGVMHAWGDVVCTIGGVPIIGITAIEYADEQEIVNHYGAGRYPVGRSKGRITPSAKITLSMEEVVAIQSQAPGGRLQDVAPWPMVVSFLPEDGQIVIDKVCNCQFKKNTRSIKEGDTRSLVEMELVISHVEWHK